MTYYDVLGVNPTDSPDDIKRAYKSLAKQYHPDSGGDVDKFHKISEAYETLRDPHERAKYDHIINQRKMTDDLEWFLRPQKRSYTRRAINKNLSTVVDLELNELLYHTVKTVSIRSLSGDRHLVNIDVPPGVNNGAKIKYPGLGDRTYASEPYGDLIVTFRIANHPEFTRDGVNLYKDYTISTWDAIVGTTIQVTTLEGRMLNLTIPAGTQYGTTFKIEGYGLPKNNDRGNLLIKVLVKIPENLSETQLNICKALRDNK